MERSQEESASHLNILTNVENVSKNTLKLPHIIVTAPPPKSLHIRTIQSHQDYLKKYLSNSYMHQE